MRQGRLWRAATLCIFVEGATVAEFHEWLRTQLREWDIAEGYGLWLKATEDEMGVIADEMRKGNMRKVVTPTSLHFKLTAREAKKVAGDFQKFKRWQTTQSIRKLPF